MQEKIMLVALAVRLELFNLRLAGAVSQVVLPLHGTGSSSRNFAETLTIYLADQVILNLIV